MLKLFILTGCDGAGKTTIWKKLPEMYLTTDHPSDEIYFEAFPKPEAKEALIKLDEPLYGSLTRHKVFETDFERFRLEYGKVAQDLTDGMYQKSDAIVICDRFYPDNMAYSLYFNPDIPIEMFDLTDKFNNCEISIVHISPNTTLWKEKYNHDEVHEGFKDLIDICYQKVFLYLVSRYPRTRVNVKIVYNRYDGQAEKEVYEHFQNI